MGLFDLVGSEAGSGKGKIGGIVLGIVTDNQDEEKLGRVKVRFPWLGDGYESGWVRVATLMAGNERGTFFLPEVGDEVVVAFDHGDMNYPYVIGALWNGEEKPPETNDDGENNVRKIKSRCGHEMIFDDASGKEKVEIHTKSGHSLLLDDESGKEKVAIKTKSGHTFLLDDKPGNEKISIEDKSGNSIQIDSVQNSIEISSKTKLSIKAPTIKIESSGMMEIKSNGILTIQGSLVKIN